MNEELGRFGLAGELCGILMRHGFQIESYEPCDPVYFGNGSLILRSPELRIQLVDDRGDKFIMYAGPTSSRWIDEHHVAQLFAPQCVASDGMSMRLSSGDTLYHLLGEYWPSIVRGFSESQLPATLRAVEEIERVRRDRFREEQRVAGWLPSEEDVNQ